MTMNFDSKGALVSLNAPSVRSGASNDFSFNLQRGAAGLDISVRGRSLDGTQLARRGSSNGKSASGRADSAFGEEPFRIAARLDRVALRNGVAIAPFALDITGVADRPATMTLSGSTGRGGAIAGTVAPAGSDRRLALTVADAGTLARGLFGFASMKNGKLDLEATLHGSAAVAAADDDTTNDYEGTATLTDFRLLNQPFLARLFSAGSLIGFGNLLQGGGIAIDELKIPFSANNGVFGIHDARATGPAIGISADGYLDRPKNEIALKGTLVPLFGINSMLGIIPGLGNLLVSKPGEGIIGMVYTVSGNADEPKVTINPLSLAFPGITRRIMEGKMPEAANAPSNNPPAPVVVTPESPGVKSDMPKP
jgi:AsmA-like C-terminal region